MEKGSYILLILDGPPVAQPFLLTQKALTERFPHKALGWNGSDGEGRKTQEFKIVYDPIIWGRNYGEFEKHNDTKTI